jgi:hypothetical protein
MASDGEAGKQYSSTSSYKLSSVKFRMLLFWRNNVLYTGSDKKKKTTSPIAREPRVGGERQTDGYKTCSELSQCYKAQLDRFTQYKWTHLQI